MKITAFVIISLVSSLAYPEEAKSDNWPVVGDYLVANGIWKGGYLGVQFCGDPFGRGVWIGWVEPGAPAWKAGLLPGDLIFQFNLQRVRTPYELIEMIRTSQPATIADVFFVRRGLMYWVPVILSKAPVSYYGGTKQSNYYEKPMQNQVYSPEGGIYFDVTYGGIRNGLKNKMLGVIINGEREVFIDTQKTKDFYLSLGEHKLLFKSYLLTTHYGSHLIGTCRKKIKVDGSLTDSPLGRVGWFLTITETDFEPLPSRPRETWGSYEIHPFIERYSHRYNLPPSLVLAVTNVESNFKQDALSPKGATGLMQLMPETCKMFGVKEAFNPKENLETGVRYLSWLLHDWSRKYPRSQRLTLALAAYNAGPKNVEKYGGIPPFNETQSYIKQVFEKYSFYKSVCKEEESLHGTDW